MNALVSAPQEPLPSDRPSGPLLRTLVLCDLADSTALIERLGDQGAATLFRKHDRLARDLVQRHIGQEIDKTDGFLVLFERPIQGVAFALDYQQELQQLGKDEGLDLRARVGVHVGDVVVWENNAADVAHGAKPIEVEGLVKPVAARLASLALPGQILASGVTASLAQRAHSELGDKEKSARWLNHGRYRFKGVPEPLQVYEIGEAGIAPLSAPPWSSKAHREVPWWRRPATVAIEATLLVGCIAASAWWALRPPPAIAFAERDWVVVGSLKNLTGGASFDDAVDTAFRLGLEQSRYVNVMSDLKVRETVGLMQRDPEKTAIDRAIGSEVALRDGARALILPTIAEIGGKVRITAEVIDPQTQATVYSESADGNGSASVLPSVDKINARLRERLGEALASVSKESQPLDQVSTTSLDALRAYSLAQRAYAKGKYAESNALYEQALKLDPDFAVARIHRARTLLAIDRKQDALAELDAAAGKAGHLGARDALYLEAWQLTLGGKQRLALEKLRLLSKLYPDFFTGQSMYAYFSYEFAHRFDNEVVAAAEHAASPKNPYPASNERLLGLLYLCNEQYDKALAKFVGIEQMTSSKRFSTAMPYAVKRDFENAEKALAQSQSSGAPSGDIARYFLELTIAVDREETEKVWRILADAKRAATTDDPRLLLSFGGLELALRSLGKSTDAHTKGMSEFARAATEALKKAEPAYRSDAQLQLLFGSYLAARLGEVELAASQLASVGAEPASGDYPLLGKMLAVAQAQLALARKEPDKAVQILKPALDGSELYLSHEVLRAAYAAKGEEDAQMGEARWLATHRGLAYAEASDFLNPLNVAAHKAAQRSLEGRLASADH